MFLYQAEDGIRYCSVTGVQTSALPICIDYETLARENPKLIYASISGFGQDGPYRDRAGFDQVAQGMGGLMWVTGLRSEERRVGDEGGGGWGWAGGDVRDGMDGVEDEER